MTHPPELVGRALALSSEGLDASQIARLLSVPRRTVADWLSGRVPRVKSEVRGDLVVERAPHAYPYLLGLYLGDGCLSEHRRGVYKLRIWLDAAYPGIIDECAAAIADVVPAGRVGRLPRTGDVEVYAYSKRWPALFPQHGSGLKHHRPIVLVDWQREVVEQAPGLLLRGLIHSDGCRFINTGRNWRSPRYAFSNRSDDIRAIFCDACDLMGLRWTTAPWTVYVSRKADVARLDDVVGPKT